jgi:PAS domain S-box-containing protein
MSKRSSPKRSANAVPGGAAAPQSWLGRTVFLGALGIALLIAASAAIDQRNTNVLNENAKWVAHTQDALVVLERFLSSLKDAETGQRSYLLTGDEKYLEASRAVRPQSVRLLDEVDSLTRDNKGQQARLASLRKETTERLKIIDEIIDLRKFKGAEAANAEIAKGLGLASMERIRAIVGEMIQTENELLAIRKRDTEDSYRLAVATSWLAEGLGLAALAAFVWLLVRHLRAAAKATEAIYRQRELLRTTLASIGDGVLTTDHQGVVTSINAVAAALTGWSSEEAVGQPLEVVFNIVDERTRKSANNPIQRCLRENAGGGFADHTVLVAKDGGERPIDHSAAPIRTADGAVVGAVLVFHDASERKRAEEELRQLAANLSRSDRRKDEFLATLAHELRNPLAPIRNGLQIIKLAGADGKAVDGARTIMERQLGHLVRLVDDLLDVSRIARDKMELRRERVELGAVLGSSVETSRPFIDAGKHRLELNLGDEKIALNADPIRLAQMFANLLNNAAKYTPPGGSITVTAHREGSDACVSFRDTGEGIAPDALPHIFDMFAQVDRSLDRSQGGLGIGLTLVKRIAEMHGGSVSARSDGVGKGCEFLVRLPVDLEAKPGTVERPDIEACDSPTGVCRVLVVDDNRDAALSLEHVLKLMGHEAVVAFDGQAAVEAAQTFHPHIILLDIGLPKLNGYEACQRIRMQTLSERPIIVAVTGWGQPRDRERSKEAGFDHYFTKPVDASQMIALLSRAPCAAG